MRRSSWEEHAPCYSLCVCARMRGCLCMRSFVRAFVWFSLLVYVTHFFKVVSESASYGIDMLLASVQFQGHEPCKSSFRKTWLLIGCSHLVGGTKEWLCRTCCMFPIVWPRMTCRSRVGVSLRKKTLCCCFGFVNIILYFRTGTIFNTTI